MWSSEGNWRDCFTPYFPWLPVLSIFPEVWSSNWVGYGNRKNNNSTMCWVLDQYLDNCKQDYIRLLSQPELTAWVLIGPHDWTPVNFDFEKGSPDDLSKFVHHNLGFVFQAKVSTVKEFIQLEETRRSELISYFPSDSDLVFVKYFSALLDVEYVGSCYNIISFMLLLKILEQSRPSPDVGNADLAQKALDCCIKHQYIALLGYACDHTFVVMADMGQDLSKLIENSKINFRQFWMETSTHNWTDSNRRFRAL